MNKDLHRNDKDVYRNYVRQQIAGLARDVVAHLESGAILFACGNGGSAEQANHLVAELVGRYRRQRCPILAISLCSNMAAITAIANDFGYDEVFARQLGMARKDDILVALSTSGRSRNVVQAVEYAIDSGLLVIGLTNSEPINRNALKDVMKDDPRNILSANSKDTPRVQEEHLWMIHTLVGRIEEKMVESQAVETPAP